MSKKTTNQRSNTLRKVLLLLLAIVGIPVVLYGYIVISSLIGRETIIVENIERKYQVYIPTTYKEEPVPLVLVFHMLTGSGKTTQWLTNFNNIAEQEGFIVVYPEGYKASWAEGSNLYAADQNQINDVVFTSELMDKLMRDYAIIPNQIYATGFSSGGLMVQRLGCELSDRITAIATVGATFSKNIIKNCNPQMPLPILMINGTDDRGVPWEGDSDYVSVPETVEYWIKQNSCSNVPGKIQMPDINADGTTVIHDAYTECLEDSSVNLYTIVGGGHTWPRGSQLVQLWGLNGTISQDIDASQAIWTFFQEQK
jgi:polyhydroxybutyrate depolymerase